jgi:DNA repair exonuclease SbcCD nuclease subunit
MKIYAISDLHVELSDYNKIINKLELNKVIPIILPEQLDILILAGDIGDPIKKRNDYVKILEYLKQFAKKTILIPGNHEYYSSKYDMKTVDDKLYEICNETGIILLNNKTIIIDNIKFIGTTLWSIASPRLEYYLNDFKYVFKSYKEYNNQFRLCYKWLTNELNKNDSNKIIIITHHLPTTKLIHPRFKNYSEINSGFATEIIDLLNLDNVIYWFCGHTHEQMTYCNQTIFHVNPVGYADEKKETKIDTTIFDI